MAFDISNYLIKDSSDSSKGCRFGSEWNSDGALDARNGRTEAARHGKWNGICLDSNRETSSMYPLKFPVGFEANFNEIFGDVSGIKPDKMREESGFRNGEEVVRRRRSGRDTVSHDSVSWNETLERRSRSQVHLQDTAESSCSVEDLRQVLKKLKTAMKTCPDPETPASVNPAVWDRIGNNEDTEDSERPTLRQLSYRSRRSLPDRLATDNQEDRKRYSRRSSVKFADEFGMNLNTFAMIPSRYNAHAHGREEVTWRLPDKNRNWRSPINQTAATDRFRRTENEYHLDIPKEIELYLVDPDRDDDGVVWPDGDTSDFRCKPTSREDGFRNPKASKNQRFSRGKQVSSSRRTESRAEPEFCSQDEGRCHEFRLCFDQPFADFETFQRKLKENFLCLENVRVEERFSRSSDEELGHEVTRTSKNCCGTTILCSVKVCHAEEPETVFARCTDNDWVTYADLPAQHLSGVTNLGFDYDTFCFAVRKPVQPPKTVERCESARNGRGPTSAVEFALCCKVEEKYYWDNNDDANYRIEWFD